MKRNVRIFGQAIPLWLVLTFVLAVGAALAYFAAYLNASLSVTAKPGAEMSFDTPLCSKLAGSGTLVTCDITGGVATIEYDQIDNDTIIEFQFSALNSTGQAVTFAFGPPDPLPAGIVSITCDRANGYSHADGVEVDYTTTIDFTDVVADQVISGVAIEYEYRP